MLFLGPDVSARLRVLPGDAASETANLRLVTVTGTYSSGDRYGIEGLAIHQGEIVSARYQGWDGIMTIQDGQLQIFNRRAVSVGDARFDLTKGAERKAFIEAAKGGNLSVLQGHLLITDGRLDVKDAEGQPRFKRRILFTTKSGEIGLYDSESAVTLYDAATQLQGEYNVDMAFNLDMGTYDFCRIDAPENATRYCGFLREDGLDKLTNLLEFQVE
ncbi:succinate dehydrogenase [Paracoccaceae bacterium GXU_MW_L88]